MNLSQKNELECFCQQTDYLSLLLTKDKILSSFLDVVTSSDKAFLWSSDYHSRHYLGGYITSRSSLTALSNKSQATVLTSVSVKYTSTRPDVSVSNTPPLDQTCQCVSSWMETLSDTAREEESLFTIASGTGCSETETEPIHTASVFYMTH